MKTIIVPFLFLWGSFVSLFADNKISTAHRLFLKWDQNKDKKLIRSELPLFAKKNFDQVDQSKDGFISLSKHVSFLSSQKKKNPNIGFSIIPNLSYSGTPNPRHTLDLILPTNPDHKKRLPLVVWIHGGGWKNGDKKTGHSPSRVPALVKTGRYAGATINYRLSGEAIWPAQIYDCKAAIRWLCANAKKYGYDSNQIALWGSSAGGHLASMLGTTGEHQTYEGILGKHTNQSTHVKAVINYYGPSALLQMNDHPSKINHNAPESPESQLMGYPIQKKRKRTQNASPLHQVSTDDATFLHFHGTKDPLVPYHQSKIFHHALLQKKVKSNLITLKDGVHSMPPSFTEKYVIPFLDYNFHGQGSAQTDQTIQWK